MRRWLQATALLAASTGLSACGDSGSSTGTAIVPDPSPPPGVTMQPRCRQLPESYCGQWGLDAIQASVAYDNIGIEPGATADWGSLAVGVFDSGAYAKHPALDGFVDLSATFSPPDVAGRTFEDGTFSRGTAVASIIAARPQSGENAMQGVAPGIPIHSYSIVLSRGDSSTYNPVPAVDPVNQDDLGARELAWSIIFNHLINGRSNILNFGSPIPGLIEHYEADSLTGSFSRVIDLFVQEDVPRTERKILVWEGGDANGQPCQGGTAGCTESDPSKVGTVDASSVEVLPGLPALITALRGHSVAVVAVDQDGKIYHTSNRCGIAANYCIAAPGVDIRVARYGSANDHEGSPIDAEECESTTGSVCSTTTASGSSLAAPFVSGSLALLTRQFRNQLAPDQILDRLLSTANRAGPYSDQTIYGRGMLDIGTATAVFGVSSVILADTVDSPGARLNGTMLSLGPAFGASPVSALADREFAAFDSMGFPYWHDLGSFAVTGASTLGDRLRHSLAESTGTDFSINLRSTSSPAGPFRIGFTRDSTGFEGIAGPSIGIEWSSPQRPLTAFAFTTEGRMEQLPMTGAMLSWKPLGLRAGILSERASALGSTGSGGFGELSARSLFTGITRSLQTGLWQLTIDGEAGVTSPNVDYGMLASLEAVTATRLALHASRPAGETGRIRFSVEQPLRAERARATFMVPLGRTPYGDILKNRWSADLAPTGRQVDLSVWWTYPTIGGQLKLGTVYALDPGHDAFAAPDLSLLAAYHLAF